MANLIKRHIILLLPIIYSCEPTIPSAELGGSDDGTPKITLNMTADLLLTVAVKNVDADLAYLGFTIIFNSETLTANRTVKKGDYNIVFSSFDYDNLEQDDLSVIFSGVSGSGDLLQLQFSGSSDKGATISIGDITLTDSNNNPLNFDYPITASVVCYIDEGVLLQYTEHSSEPMEDWTPTDNYLWTTNFCQYY